MATYIEPQNLDDVVRRELDRVFCREQVVFASGHDIAVGQVVGKILFDFPAAGTPDAGNTGDGVLSGVALGDAPQVGNYTVQCAAVDTTPDAATGTAAGGNTGTGAIGAVAVDASAVLGVYELACVSAAENGGVFLVRSPGGAQFGEAEVGVAFSAGGLTFTIADGETDFAVGDRFFLSVSGAGGSRWEVRGPDGVLGYANAGEAFEHAAIGFTITEGETAFALGDVFTLAVSKGSGKTVPIDFTASDGSQDPAGLAIARYDARAADVRGVIIHQNALVMFSGLVWPDDATTEQKTQTLAKLAARGVMEA